MNIIHAAMLGAVEGLTEFLPVSSTAHLIIASNVLGLSHSEFQKFFEVFIQSGAILAVIFLYGEYLIKNKSLVPKLALSFAPTAVIGFLLYQVIKNVFFDSGYLIIGALAAVGCIFLLVEYLISTKKITLNLQVDKISNSQAILTGLAQALAVVPGVSRSGIVMLYLMGQGYKREDAATYSFLLAVPTIVAASGYDLFKMRHLFGQSTDYVPLLAVGFISSFIVAYAVMKWFIGYLKRNTLVSFGVYRIILAIILLLV